MDNRLIRQRARQVFMTHYWKIGAVVLGCALLSSLPGIAALIGDWTLPDWVDLVWGLLVAPLCAAGLTQFVYGLWRGEPPNAARLLAFFRTPGLVIRAMGVEFVVGLIPSLIMLLPFLLMMFVGPDMGIMLLLLTIPIMLYLLFRMDAAMTAFVRNPERTARQAIAHSWRATNGSVGRIFAMELAVSWPMLLVTLPTMLGVNGLTEEMLRPVNWLATGTSLALAFLYSGYIYLATVGLASELIDECERLDNPPYMTDDRPRVEDDRP